MDSIPLHVEDVALVGMTVSEGGSATLSVGAEVFSPAVYHGTYSVTPSGVAQVLATAGMALREDVTVEPIPSNYGLVTWDGSVLTVS